MKKNIITIVYALLVTLSLHAQTPTEGAMQIDDGFLVYVLNDRGSSYTIELTGEVGIADFPLIRDNGMYYMIKTAPKQVFGNDDKTRLLRFMNLEVKKFNKEYSLQKKPEHKTALVKETLFNIWKYAKPTVDTTATHKKIVAHYFLDFVHDDTLFRISYPATTSDDKQARVALYKVYKKMHFYDTLDVEKLQNYVAQGMYFYPE